MPLFKTRSAKIEPFNGTNELETIDVENTHPRMELFVKVSSSNSHDSAKRRLVLSERMDDPEEVCELSPLSLYFIQQENHLDISSIKDQQVFFRRSMDFCQKDFPPPPNFQPTRTNHADERLKHSLLSNSNGRRVRFPADVLVFACVLENLSEDLELVLRYSNVDLNAYLNARDLSPLHVAALLGNTECIQVLLRYGANVHCLDNSGHSPLYKAFSGHHFECAVLLIEHGANINHFTRQKIKEVERLKKKSKLYKRDDLED
ncbi:Protein phosphatase 1 regulatory subunit 27 [Exaiptasia diaphana]|nr:Protein phosphatase 1 regulatory subunit 27 [Exaiptasia diaphana]